MKRYNEITENIKSQFPFGGPVIGVEVGVNRGDTSKILLELNPELFLYMVDRWTAPVEGDPHLKSGSVFATMSQQEYERRRTASYNVASLFPGRAEIKDGNSLDMAKTFEKASVDFVFIDADHSYEGCLADIKAWLPKIKAGGFICGHDYGSATFPGVKKAVDECFDRITVGDDKVWVADVNTLIRSTKHTVCFDYDGQTLYRDMLKTMVTNDPSIEVMEIDSPKIVKSLTDPNIQGLQSNYEKTLKWLELLEGTKKHNIILLDCDLLILRSLEHIFKEDFDIVFTKRDREDNEPINTGVVWVKKSKKVLEFFRGLSAVCKGMMEDKELHSKYREKWKGIMQAALGYMIENNLTEGLNIKYVPCKYYNACDGEYDSFSSGTRVIHLKKKMRQTILRGGRTQSEKHQKIYNVWKDYANRAGVDIEKYRDSHVGYVKGKASIIKPKKITQDSQKIAKVFNRGQRDFLVNTQSGKKTVKSQRYLDLPENIAKKIVANYPRELEIME